MKKAGRPYMYDYDADDFYTEVESLAANGYTDKEIASGLSKPLAYKTFSDIKNEKGKNGEPTTRSERLNGALSRGRVKINQAIKSTYLQTILGQRIIKTTTNQRFRLKDGTLTEDELISTVTAETPPSLQGLSTWLFNHNDEWRENIIKHKQEEAELVSAESNTPSSVNVRITYNQKSDLTLQEKFKKQSQ